MQEEFSVRIDKSTFERVEDSTLTNQNSIVEKIKGTLRSSFGAESFVF